MFWSERFLCNIIINPQNENRYRVFFTSMSGGRMSLVSLLAAMGTMTLLCMPARAPSKAKVLDKPTKPSLAAL